MNIIELPGRSTGVSLGEMRYDNSHDAISCDVPQSSEPFPHERLFVCRDRSRSGLSQELTCCQGFPLHGRGDVVSTEFQERWRYVEKVGPLYLTV